MRVAKAMLMAMGATVDDAHSSSEEVDEEHHDVDWMHKEADAGFLAVRYCGDNVVKQDIASTM